MQLQKMLPTVPFFLFPKSAQYVLPAHQKTLWPAVLSRTKRQKALSIRVFQALKEQKTEELFEMVKEKLLSYRRTDAYEAFLLAQIGKAQEFAQGEDLTVFISPSDQERQAVLEEKSGCRVEIAEDEFSGGMRAVIPAKNVLIDESFAERMKHAGEICWI